MNTKLHVNQALFFLFTLESVFEHKHISQSPQESGISGTPAALKIKFPVNYYFMIFNSTT